MGEPSRGRRVLLSGDTILKGAVGAASAFVLFLLILLAYELVSGSRLSLGTFGLQFMITTTWDPVHSVFGALPFVYGTLLTSAIALYSRAGFTMREGAERDFHGVPLFEMEKSL